MKGYGYANTGKDTRRRLTAFILAAAMISCAAISPVLLTSERMMPYTQRAAVYAASTIMPHGDSAALTQTVSGGDVISPAESSASDASIEAAETTAAPVETTTAATTSTTAQTTVPGDIPDGMKPVVESQLSGSNTHEGGIYLKNGAGYKLDISGSLEKKPFCKIKLNAGYQVLIIHTHTTESYAETDRSWYDPDYSPRTADKSRNVIAVGDVIAEQLESAGIKTLHVTTVHDYPQYNGSYDRAAETISGYLEKYPSIEMVIDVHRDAITRDDGSKVKPTCTIDGKKAAQVMIITGCDNNGQLYFPEWGKNFIMATHLQKQIASKYEGLMRPLYFAPFRYNMHLTPNSLLIEFGTDVNTLDEAKRSAKIVGEGLRDVLLRCVVE